MNEETQEWREQEHGKSYKRRINLYQTNDKNERMYVGDQWKGVDARGLPTPVFNIFKRVIDYFIASILSKSVKMQFTPENIGDDTQDENELFIKEAAETITGYSDTLWETLKMSTVLRQALLDAALSGDACAFMYFDVSKETGQEAKGDIELELVDNVNVFFGNPNDRRVQKQPYILISFRELVSNLKKEAELNGVNEVDIEKIIADSDNLDQSGDMSKIELEGDTSGKTTALIKLWKDTDGYICWNKSTKNVVIRKDVKTKRKLYPIAWMNWTSRKNSYHGQAIGTGLTSNQIFINKLFAMVMVNLMHTAFPKVVYNSDFIDSWSNQIGEAIKVTGAQDIRQVANYLQPGEMSAQVMSVIDIAIKYTKDMIGASDAALGDVKPENTSAIIAVSQQAAIPLGNIEANLYQWVEDIGYIWLDFMAANYGKRKITTNINGQKQVKVFDFDKLQDMRLKLKIDVGPSSYWSEITAMQTLDNLLSTEKISFLQYLDRVPNGVIPKKQELIEELKGQMQDDMFVQQIISQFMETLPPEIQDMLAQMPPEEAEAQVKQMMLQPPQQETMPAEMGGDVYAEEEIA